jgi:hypothetical protein
MRSVSPTPHMSPIRNLIRSLCDRQNRSHGDRPQPKPTTSPSNHPPPLVPTNLGGQTASENPTHAPYTTTSNAALAGSTDITLFPSDLGLHQILTGTDSRAIVKVMEDRLAKGTKGNYASALNAYAKFCDIHAVDKALRFPADEHVLCAFASSMNNLVAGTTASTAITALKRWHEMHPYQQRFLRTHENDCTSETRG